MSLSPLLDLFSAIFRSRLFAKNDCRDLRQRTSTPILIVLSLRIFRPHYLPDPENCLTEEIKAAMGCSPDGKSLRRPQGIQLLLIGEPSVMSGATAAAAGVSSATGQTRLRNLEGETFAFNTLPVSGNPRVPTIPTEPSQIFAAGCTRKNS